MMTTKGWGLPRCLGCRFFSCHRRCSLSLKISSNPYSWLTLSSRVEWIKNAGCNVNITKQSRLQFLHRRKRLVYSRGQGASKALGWRHFHQVPSPIDAELTHMSLKLTPWPELENPTPVSYTLINSNRWGTIKRNNQWNRNNTEPHVNDSSNLTMIRDRVRQTKRSLGRQTAIDDSFSRTTRASHA